MVSCRVSLPFVEIQCDSLIPLSTASQEASVFFKKRAILEEEYGRGIQKLAKNTSEVYAMNDGKAR